MRDGIAEWVNALAIVATVCEAVALEVRHGQRTRCGNWPSRPVGPEGLLSDAAQEEPDPVRAYRRLARIIRGYVTPVTEGIPLWHERDISHSSVERIRVA